MRANPAPRTLDPAVIAKIESLSLRARIIVEGALSGLHRARSRGSSIEFAEHKEYAPGDEIRHLDWKAYAKLDRYYVKQFEQETQLTAYLVLDASGSMDYGNGALNKFAYASSLLAALAFLLIHQRDRVGLSVFGDSTIDAYIPPRARPAHLHDLLAVIHRFQVKGATGNEPAAAALRRIAELARRKRSLIVLASDLLEDEDNALPTLCRLRAQKHDVAFFHILDTDEIDLPFEGLTLFQSAESNHRLLVNPRAIRSEYHRRLQQFLHRVSTECVAAGIDYQLVTTAHPLDRVLADYLAARNRRKTKDQRILTGSR